MDVRLIQSDDWEGIYVNEKLTNEGHSLSTRDILESLNIKYNSAWVDSEWLEDNGSLPYNIGEIPEGAYVD